MTGKVEGCECNFPYIIGARHLFDGSYSYIYIIYFELVREYIVHVIGTKFESSRALTEVIERYSGSLAEAMDGPYGHFFALAWTTMGLPASEVRSYRASSRM